jgi:hypothetical protein
MNQSVASQCYFRRSQIYQHHQTQAVPFQHTAKHQKDWKQAAKWHALQEHQPCVIQSQKGNYMSPWALSLTRQRYHSFTRKHAPWHAGHWRQQLAYIGIDRMIMLVKMTSVIHMKTSFINKGLYIKTWIMKQHDLKHLGPPLFLIVMNCTVRTCQSPVDILCSYLNMIGPSLHSVCTCEHVRSKLSVSRKTTLLE